jgi:hypothetical protein
MAENYVEQEQYGTGWDKKCSLTAYSKTPSPSPCGVCFLTPQGKSSPIEGEGRPDVNVCSGEWIGYERVCY